MKNLFLVVLALLCGNALCVKYQADITITNDPYMPNAKIRAELSYQYDSSKHTAFFRYPDFGMSEFINYTGSKRLIYCTECESETIGSDDRLHWISGDKSSVTEDGCTKYTRTRTTGSKDQVTEIWTKGASENAEVCKVVFVGGKTYTYSNFSTNPPTDRLAENLNWKCPQPICTKSVDVVLVLDRSGSIDWTEWRQMVSFAKDVIDSFGQNTARFGISTFASKGAKGIDLTDDVQSVKNKLDSYGKPSGGTCIGCGIKIADEYLKNARAGATKIMVVFSDGGDCSGKKEGNVEHYKTASENAKKNGITIVAVGIGNGISEKEMKIVASENATGEDLYKKAESFADLENILGDLVKETCSAAPDTYKSCGSTCGGFCSCKQTCVCPTCETSDKCTQYTCSASNAGAGCKAIKTDCFKDICHNSACNPKTGCVHTPIDCSHVKKYDCHEAVCDPLIGGCLPRLNASKCPHKDCHSVECTLDHGCVYTPLCKERNCYNSSCVNDKCVYTPVFCGTDTKCTRYGCNPVTDKCFSEDIKYPVRPCYNMSCDDIIGPVYTVYNCSGNVGNCEKSYCDPESDSCKIAVIDNCDVCKNVDCSNLTNGCGEGKCRAENGKAECYYEQTVDCTAPCVDGLVCNNDTGHCDKDPKKNYIDYCEKDTKDNECMESKCDIVKKKCVNTTKTCDAQLPCNIGWCEPGGTKCIYANETVCEKNRSSCEVANCSKGSNGEAVCTYKSRTCSPDSNTDFNPDCQTMVCNNKTDKCEIISNCDPCKGVPCEDGDPCTDDVCVVENGEAVCKYTPRCPEGDDYCNPVVCNIFGNCVVEPRSCRHIDVSGKEQSCYKVECVKSAAECRKVVIEGAFTDVCGKCIQSFGDNETELKEKQEDTACIGALRAEEFAAALTGAAIAGIIIACVVVAAIIATAGYFGTKELIRRAKMAQDQSANNNPLYEGNANEMSNPSYAGAE